MDDGEILLIILEFTLRGHCIYPVFVTKSNHVLGVKEVEGGPCQAEKEE